MTCKTCGLPDDICVCNEIKKEMTSDETHFTVRERKDILEKVEHLLTENIDKVSYKNRMLYLYIKKSMIAFSFSGDLFDDRKQYLSRITIFDSGLNTITGINEENGYKNVWDRIDQKLLSKYIEGFKKYKIPVDDVLKLLGNGGT